MRPRFGTPTEGLCHEALRQGSLDGLCGLYAIINSLDPAGLKVRRGQLHADLFKELAYGLGSVSLLAAMREGLHRQELMRTAAAGFRWLELEYGHRLVLEAPFANRRFNSPRTFLQALRQLLNAGDQAVIVYVRTPNRDHWTVATDITGQELTLRDSGGLCALSVPQLVAAGSGWSLVPGETLVVRRLSAGKCR